MSEPLHACAGSPGSAVGPASAGPLGRRLLLLAFGATFLSRTVAGAVVESLRAELWLTDQALGTLVSAFAGAYALGLPAGAVLGLRGRRTRQLAGALAVCGVATAASALAIGFWTLVAARFAAGAGAGLAAGLVVTLLLDGDGEHRPGLPPRGMLLPAVAGLALGYALGGVCGRWPGWRGAFIASGLVVLALAPACLRAADPPRHGLDPWSSLRAEGAARVLRRMAAAGTLWLPALAAIAGASAASALAFWLPAFLERTRGVPRLVAGLQLGLAVLASGFAGAALGRAGLRRGGSRQIAGSWTAAVGTAGAGVAMAVALAVGSPAVVLPTLMLALLGAFAAARGAMSASGDEASDPALVAVVLLLVHGAGELGGAFGLGAVADRASFGRALYLLPAVLVASAALWASAAWAQARRGRAAAHPVRDGDLTPS